MTQILPPLNLAPKATGTPSGSTTPLAMAGDVAGTTAANVITKIRGNNVQAGTYGILQDGYVLTWANTDGYLTMKPGGVAGGSWPTTEPGTVSISDPINIETTSGTITLTAPSGMAPGIRIQTLGGGVGLLVESEGSSTISSDGDVLLESVEGAVLIKGKTGGDGGVMIVSEGTLYLQSTDNNVEVLCNNGTLDISADQLDLDASSAATIHSNGPVSITTVDNVHLGVSTMGGTSVMDFTDSAITLNSASGLSIGDNGGASIIAFSGHATISAPSLTIPNAIRAVSIHLPGQAAAITLTDLITSPGSGLYAIDVYMVTTTTNSGSISVNIHYTDEAGALMQTTDALDLSTTDRVMERLVVAVNMDALQFSTTGSIGVGAQYSLRISVTKIG